jgi:hypothetical protein
MAALRNVAIVAVIAALVVLVPGGGPAASVLTQAVSLTFLAGIAWIATIQYRQHRVELYSLGDRRRLILYVAAGAATLTLTGTHKLWATSAGSVAWLALVAGSAYAAFAVIWSARRS